MYKIVEINSKNKVKKDLKNIAGMKLLILDNNIKNTDLYILGALSLNENEKFYKNAYETWGKYLISIDYFIFLKFCLTESFHGNYAVNISDIKYIKDANQVDIVNASNSFKDFELKMKLSFDLAPLKQSKCLQ